MTFDFGVYGEMKKLMDNAAFKSTIEDIRAYGLKSIEPDLAAMNRGLQDLVRIHGIDDTLKRRHLAGLFGQQIMPPAHLINNSIERNMPGLASVIDNVYGADLIRQQLDLSVVGLDAYRAALVHQTQLPDTMLAFRGIEDVASIAWDATDFPVASVDMGAIRAVMLDGLVPSNSLQELIDTLRRGTDNADLGSRAAAATVRHRLFNDLGFSASEVLASVALNGVRLDLPRPDTLDAVRAILDMPAFRAEGVFDRLVDELYANGITDEDISEAAGSLHLAGSDLSQDDARKAVFGLVYLAVLYGCVALSSPASLGPSLLSIEFLLWVFGIHGIARGSAAWVSNRAVKPTAEPGGDEQQPNSPTGG